MIREIEMENWLCYEGRHVLKLKSLSYAVTARYEIDPARSNMGGKSAIFEAVDFAVTGRLAKFRKLTADGWITKGTKKGFVQVTFEDGTIIRRERIRGKRTDVTMTNVGGQKSAQEDAEINILKHFAFDANDFSTIAYFEQDAMNRIVRTEPEKRFDIVRGWLGLQAAERAEISTGEIVKKRIREVQRLNARRTTILTVFGKGEGEEYPAIADLETERQEILISVAEQTAARDYVRVLVEDIRIVQQYDDLVERGKEASQEVENLSGGADLEERLQEVEQYVTEQAAVHTAAVTVAEAKKKVSLGLFNGKCPVAEIECPATKMINADREGSSASYEAAKVKEQRAYKAVTLARAAVAVIKDEARDHLVKRTNLESLRARAKELLDNVRVSRKRIKAADKEGLPGAQEIEERLRELRDQQLKVTTLIAEYNARQKQGEVLGKELTIVELALEAETQAASTATVARTIFRATQRRVAERALETIGDGANKMLRDSGIDLSIDIQWEREGGDWAKACEMCGSAFPSSAKVKRCEVCDAERGKNVVQKLEFLVSDRSGAADDFAGIGLQLAAGSYLLRLRQSSWASAMIDEPFAKMDKSVRKGVARQLLSLLGSGAYRQMFVISHSDDTLSMYPARINIYVARDGTRSIETT